MSSKDRREPVGKNVPRPEGEVTNDSDSQSWSHTAQAGSEERKGRALLFKIPTRPTMLRRTIASGAQGSGADIRTSRPGSMCPRTSARFPQGGFIDRQSQIPPGVQVSRAPNELVATPRHLSSGHMGARPPQAGAGLNSSPTPGSQFSITPPPWRRVREDRRAPGRGSLWPRYPQIGGQR